MQNIPELELSNGQPERLVFCKDQIITFGQVALLIIKPSNFVLNANNSKQNVASIIGRFADRGWELQALKVVAGSDANVVRLIAHYPQPFFDGRTEEDSTRLNADERAALEHIWGTAALQYPIYHPLQLVEKGVADYRTLAAVWHAGRGTDNHLLDVGSPDGINTVSKQKDPNYGRRRLLLVQNNPTLPGREPFFIVNGFSAELVTKFSREGERIVFMVFGQEDRGCGLEEIREDTVGATNPREAKPGSIRSDALHAAGYRGPYPIVSADKVGIENNIVHLSENLTEARREIDLWVPEVLWYPPSGLFAPDIALGTWENLRDRHVHGRLQTESPHITNPDATALQRLSRLAPPDKPPKISVNLMAGGSGGRFFGYELPEHMRNKLFAPIVPIGHRTYSFLELQLARVAGGNQGGFIRRVNVIAAENTGETIQAKLDELKSNASELAETLAKTSVLVRQGVPRIVPLTNDLLAESKFTAYCEQHGLDTREAADTATRHAGDIVQVNGAIAVKPPGHLSVLLHYIYHRLKTELEQGIEVAFFHIGEDAAAEPDGRLLAYGRDNGAVATVEVAESAVARKGGYVVDAGGRLQVTELEAPARLGLRPPFYFNTTRMAVNTKRLAGFLAGEGKTFEDLDELQIRQVVEERIVRQLVPLFEIKPVHNYAAWVGQFAYAIGQISEAVPTAFVVRDDALADLVPFKTQEDLQAMLPAIRKLYGPYLQYLG